MTSEATRTKPQGIWPWVFENGTLYVTQRCFWRLNRLIMEAPTSADMATIHAMRRIGVQDHEFQPFMGSEIKIVVTLADTHEDIDR